MPGSGRTSRRQLSPVTSTTARQFQGEPGRSRTCSLLIRSQARCPLRHWPQSLVPSGDPTVLSIPARCVGDQREVARRHLSPSCPIHDSLALPTYGGEVSVGSTGPTTQEKRCLCEVPPQGSQAAKEDGGLQPLGCSGGLKETLPAPCKVWLQFPANAELGAAQDSLEL